MDQQLMNSNDMFLLFCLRYPSWLDSVQPLVFKKGCKDYLEYRCYLCVYFIRFVASLLKKQKEIKQQAISDRLLCIDFLKAHNLQLYEVIFDKDGNELELSLSS